MTFIGEMLVQMIEPHTRQALIERAKKGSRGAFDQLVEDSRSQVEAALISFVDPALRSSLELDELVQETFVVAFRSLERFDWRGEGSFVAWLGGIARNVVYSAIRKARNRKPLEIVGELSTPDASPSKGARRDERFDRLQTAFNGLSEDHREVLRLARLEGLSANAIAERMGRSPEAIRQLLSRALKQLKKSFGDTESLHLPDRRLTEAEDGE